MKKFLKKIYLFLNLILRKFGFQLTRSNSIFNDDRNPSLDFMKSEEYAVSFFKKEIENDFYFIPKFATHRPAAADLIEGKFHEPDTHKLVELFLNKNGGSILHAGTFYGDMLPKFSKFSKFVYSFEPLMENFILANLCVQENDLTNTFLYNAALSNTDEIVRISSQSFTGKHAGGTSKIAKDGLLTPSCKIDNFEYDNLKILHLDIEGHELPALKGGEKTINKHRPLVLVEDNENTCENFLIKMDYKKIAQIPSINIYAPVEKPNYQTFINEMSFIVHKL